MTIFRKYILLTFIVSLLNVLIILLFFVPRLNATDSAQYISTIQHVSGDSSATLYSYRILKPLPILIGVVLLPIMSAAQALILQNVIFYFATVLLIFLLINSVYKNEKQAFYGTVLFSTAYPVMAYGLSPLTDFGGWFFYILCIYLTIIFFNNPTYKKSFLIGFLGGIGMLFKENLAALLIFLPSFVLLCTHLTVKEKMRHILGFGVAFLSPIFISGIIVYRFFSYSMIQWYIDVSLHHEGSSVYAYSPLRIIIEIGRIFSLGWVFFLVGVTKEIKTKNKERINLLISLVPSSLSFFLWAFPHNRIAFISAPLIVLLGSFGLVELFKKYKFSKYIEISLLLICVLTNYFLVEFLLKYGDILRPMF
jgi:hypothetical protein